MPRPEPLWKLPRAEAYAARKARRASRKDVPMSLNDNAIAADLDAALANARGEQVAGDVIDLAARIEKADAADTVVEAAGAGLLSAGFDPADILAILGEMHTLGADVTGFLLDTIKQNPKPWQQMSCGEQEALIERLTVRSGALVRGIVRTLAAGGRQTIVANVKAVNNEEKAIKIVLTARHDSEHRHVLFDSHGLEVLIVVADAGECFQGDQPRPDAKGGQQDLFDGEDNGPVFDHTDSAAE